MASQIGAIMRPLPVMMSREVFTIQPDATLREAAKRMRDERVGCLLVKDRGGYTGIVSETDLVRKGMADDRDAASETVATMMSSPLITIDISRSAHDASDLMAEQGIRHLAVVEDGKVVGLISVRDLLRYFKNWGVL